MTHTKEEKVKYCIVEHSLWDNYPTFNTREEAYEFKAEREEEHPAVYILEPISVKVYYER
jgi:hypothetical protein